MKVPLVAKENIATIAPYLLHRVWKKMQTEMLRVQPYTLLIMSFKILCLCHAPVLYRYGKIVLCHGSAKNNFFGF